MTRIIRPSPVPVGSWDKETEEQLNSNTTIMEVLMFHSLGWQGFLKVTKD
jgi:hypothetical protein